MVQSPSRRPSSSPRGKPRPKLQIRNYLLILLTAFAIIGFGYEAFLELKSILKARKVYVRQILLNGIETIHASALQPTRLIRYPMARDSFFKALADSEDYDNIRADPTSTDECEPQYSWQASHNPSCNAVHELDLARFYDNDRQRVRLINNGHWRDVWLIQDGAGIDRVIKTLRYGHLVTERNIDRNRRDAVSLERLSSSPHVVDVYGYCSISGVFEYSDGGDITEAIWSNGDGNQPRDLSSLDKLRIATQAIMGLADAHTTDDPNQSAIAHADIGLTQYIMIDGRYKLNDFNRARFLLKNRTTGATCPYQIGSNPGKNRSPEEYAYENMTEKVDVYSYGNIIHALLTHAVLLQDMSVDEARTYIKEGKRPPVQQDIMESSDPIVQTLLQALQMCWINDPTQRATARQVEAVLKAKLEEVDPGRLKEWAD